MARDFSDEQLTAYLDGEHEFAPVAEIEAALETDVQLQKRLASLSFDDAALRGAFDKMLVKAPPLPALDAASATPPVQRASPSYAWQAAAAAALLAIGIGLGQFFAPAKPALNGWRDYAAAYQSLYNKETLASVAPNGVELVEILKRFDVAAGKKLSPSQITTAPTLSFKRAQILSFKDKPIVQIAYVTSSGEPVALCIMKGAKTAQVTIGERHGLASAAWGRDGYEYLLIGTKDQKMIEEAAKLFSAAI